MGEQFNVQVLTRREELGGLRAPWEALWQRCPAATTFQRPEWLLPWCRELGPEEVLVLSCWSERELVGLAPLAIHSLGAERVVALLGAGISDYNDVLAAPGAEVAVAEAVFACLRERADAWDLADFGDLRGSSPLLSVEAPPGWSDEIEKHEACPRLTLPEHEACPRLTLPAPQDEAQDEACPRLTLPAQDEACPRLTSACPRLPLPEGASPEGLFPPEIRARLGRARRRLARAGAVRVEVASEEHVDELLDALFANHRARWEARGAGGVLGEQLRPFHRAVARGLAARGALRLFALRLDARIIASLYGFAERDGLASYITGFDPELAWYSPGLVMLASAIEHAAAEGARVVDFLRGREPYKYEWGAVDRWTYRRRLRYERAGGAARVGSVGEREGAIDGVLAGALSPEVGLVRLLGDAGDLDGAARAIEAALPATAEAQARLDALRRCFEARRAVCTTVAEMLRMHRDVDRDGVDGPARCARLFDALCARSEEASVAAYSLGDPEILERATREVVDLLDGWGVIGSDRAILQIGCGIGRFEAALAPRVREAWGLDVAPRMIEAARRRCAGLPNVVLEVASGVDLRGVPSCRFDLVYAVDSFPYLVDAGPAVVDQHVAEARRVLRPGGELVILSYSYRGDAARDAADVARLAARHSFDVLVHGEKPFSLWDGRAYRLRVRPDPG